MIPRILFKDSSLSETDRMLMGLIISLTLKNTYCYANNEYLEKYINKSQRTINYSLSKLKKLEYINIKYENGKRKIYLNNNKIPTKVAIDSAKTCNKEYASDCTHNINNKYKNKYNKNKEIMPYWMEHPEICKSSPASKEELEELEKILSEFKEDWYMIKNNKVMFYKK